MKKTIIALLLALPMVCLAQKELSYSYSCKTETPVPCDSIYERVKYFFDKDNLFFRYSKLEDDKANHRLVYRIQASRAVDHYKQPLNYSSDYIRFDAEIKITDNGYDVKYTDFHQFGGRIGHAGYIGNTEENIKEVFADGAICTRWLKTCLQFTVEYGIQYYNAVFGEYNNI